jgi:hypothetical protein
MSCKVKSVKDPMLAAMIAKYGAKDAITLYLNDRTSPVQYDDALPSNNDNKYQVLINQKELQVKILNENIQKARAKKNEIKVRDFVNTKEKVLEEIENLKNQETFSKVISIGNSDIEEVRRILTGDSLSESDLLYTLELLKFWTSEYTDQFLMESDITDQSLNYQELKKIRDAAHELHRYSWTNASHLAIQQSVKDITGKNISVKDIKELREEGRASALFLDAAQSRNLVIRAIDRIIKEANTKAELETAKELGKWDKLTEKLIKAAGTSNPKKLFEKFKQTWADGKATGQIVHRFSPEFFEAIKDNIPKGAKRKDGKAWKRYKKFIKENTLLFDYRVLFPEVYKDLHTNAKEFDRTYIDNHIKELKRHLGEKGYEFYLKQAEKQLAKFENRFELFKEQLAVKDLSLAEEMQAIDDWLVKYSPFSYANTYFNNETTVTNNEKFFQGYEYLIQVPRRFDSNNKDTNFYDKNFQFIESNSAYLEYYNEFMDTLKQYKAFYPQHVKEGLQSNYLPELPVNLFDNINISNITSIPKVLYNSYVNSVGINEIWDNNVVEMDSTGKPRLKLPVYMMDNVYGKVTDEEYDSILKEAKIKHPNDKKAQRLYKASEIKRIVAEKAKNKSFDLTKVIKAFSAVSNSYKHKSSIEDLVRLYDVAIKDAKEQILDAEGNQVNSSKWGALAAKGGLNNLREMWEYQFEVFFDKKKKETVSKNKVYTIEERKKRKAINEEVKKTKQAFESGKITKEEYEAKTEALKDELQSIGKYVVKERQYELFLRYLHVKGLGWNVYSAATNLGFGYVSNFTWAAGAEDFNTSQLRKAYRMLWNTLGADFVRNKKAKKLLSLIEKYNVLGDIKENYNKGSAYNSSVNKGLSKLSPYELTKRAEFFNQGSTFIALMLNTKVTVNGKEVNLFEAHDDEGNFIGDDKAWDTAGSKQTKFKTKIVEINKKIHGNYDPNSPVLLKKTVFGRMLIMFRSWIAEGFNNRFGELNHNEILERDTKGRLRALIPLFFNDTTVNKDGTENNIFQNYFFLANDLKRQLLKALTFGYYNKDVNTQLSDLDKANMRKNATEILIYIGLIAMGLMLKASASDDPEEKAVINYFVNISHRLQDDVIFYVWPDSFFKILKNPIPATKIVDDVTDWISASVRLIMGDDVISSGVNAGDSRWLRETMQLFPITTPVYNTMQASKQVYEETLWEKLFGGDD